MIINVKATIKKVNISGYYTFNDTKAANTYLKLEMAVIIITKSPNSFRKHNTENNPKIYIFPVQKYNSGEDKILSLPLSYF